MKKILFVLDGGFDGGGAERVASRLINEWIRNGVNVTVVSLSSMKDEFYELPIQVERVFLGQITYSKNPFSKFFFHFTSLVKLRRTIRESQAHVVLSFLTRTNIRTIVASFGLAKRVVISERNDPSRQQYKLVWKLLRRLLYKRAAVTTANTMGAIKYMRRYVPEACLAYIHNPVMLSVQHAEPANSSIILNVGRLVPQKGQAMMLEAFAIAGLPDWEVHILGDGPEKNELLSKAKSLGIQDKVSIKGFISDTEKYYLKSGIFVLASEYEGMSNALLEAMSFGLPCVVSNSLPGALEHIRHLETGLVFEEGDVIDLAEKLHMLMSTPNLREKLGNAARIRIEQFSTAKVIQAWDEILFPAKLIP